MTGSWSFIFPVRREAGRLACSHSIQFSRFRHKGVRYVPLSPLSMAILSDPASTFAPLHKTGAPHRRRQSGVGVSRLRLPSSLVVSFQKDARFQSPAPRS